MYDSVYYIYIYHILNGFAEAWKNKKPFNWEKLLSFCLSYITSKKFLSGELKLENDGLNVTTDWIYSSVARLLISGMQNDNNAFELELLPIAKEIVKILVINLRFVEESKHTNMDYPSYSLNSTAGTALRALVDYSLRRARNQFNVSPPRTPSSLQENCNASLLIWNLKIQASHKSCRHI